MFTNTINHRGRTWEYIYLVTDSLLSDDQRTHLLMQVLDLYAEKEQRRKIKGDGFEGTAYKGKRFYLEGFGGYKYDVELDVEKRKKPSKLSFLVAEKIDSSLN